VVPKRPPPILSLTRNINNILAHPVDTSFVGAILPGIAVPVKPIPHVSYVIIVSARVIMLGMRYFFIGPHPGDVAIVVIWRRGMQRGCVRDIVLHPLRRRRKRRRK
jgi:hypothetical protein